MWKAGAIDFWVIWLVVGVVFSILEITTPAFFYLWFGVGAFVTAFLSQFLPFFWQLVVFSGVSTLLLLFTRPIVKKIYDGKPPKEINVDEILHKKAVVLERIDNMTGTGLIRVNGDVWRAFSELDDVVIEKGEYVEILKVEGAHVVVRRVKE